MFFILDLSDANVCKNFSDFNPENRTAATDRNDAWQLPDAYLVDFNVRYKFNVGSFDAKLFANINNVLDSEYIADALDAQNHTTSDALVYYGFGRTWSTGLKINF